MEILESYTDSYFEMNVAPHGTTQRLYITPPSTRRYHITQIFLCLYRTGTATTQGISRIEVIIQRETGGLKPIAMAILYGTSAGTRDVVNMTADITLHPGDTLTVNTIDTSVGGTISYWATINYDAIP